MSDDSLPTITEFHIVSAALPIPKGAVVDPDMTDKLTAMGHDAHGEFTLSWSGNDTLDGRHIWSLDYFDYKATDDANSGPINDIVPMPYWSDTTDPYTWDFVLGIADGLDHLNTTDTGLLLNP